jgi:uncharacterized Zn finger protein
LREGALLEPVRQGLELRAECIESDVEPYRVSARLGAKGVEETSCTCPYDWGGVCKHVVALLLAYVRRPQTFRDVAPLEAMLAGRSKGDLIALIGEMVQREPALMSVVEMSAATRQAGRGAQVDAEVYRRQARRALCDDNPRVVESELKRLRDAGTRLAQASDWLNAGAFYHAVLDETVRQYDDELHMMDEDSRLAVLVDEFAKGLSLCLERGEADAQTRRAWLEALLAAELADIKMGGIDLAPSAREAILEHARDEEWAWIEKRVSAEIKQSDGWAREALVKLLAGRRQRRGQTAEAAKLIREKGTPEQQVFLLVKEGETDEALRRMRPIIGEKPAWRFSSRTRYGRPERATGRLSWPWSKRAAATRGAPSGWQNITAATARRSRLLNGSVKFF